MSDIMYVGGIFLHREFPTVGHLMGQVGRNMRKDKSIDLLTTPVEFFQDLVERAVSSQNVCTSDAAQRYLVELLSQFLHTTQLQDGISPLAIRMHQASLFSPEEKLHTFKQLGDYSLYISGFFSESLKRKVIDVDYYINIGSVAYLNAAGLHPQNTFQKLFNELSKKFTKFVEVLSQVSHQTQVSSEYNDILRLYEKWLKTKNQYLLKLLSEHGLIPIQNLNTDFEQ